MIDATGIKLRMDISDDSKDSLIAALLSESIDVVGHRLGVTISGTSIIEKRTFKSGSHVLSLPIESITSITETVDETTTDITANCSWTLNTVNVVAYGSLQYGGSYLTFTYTTTTKTINILSRLVARICIYELMKTPAFNNFAFTKSMSDNGGGVSYASDKDVQDDITRELALIKPGVIM